MSKKKTLAQQTTIACSDPIDALTQARLALTNHRTAIASVEDKISQLRDKEQSLSRESSERIDQGKDITGVTAKLAGLRAEKDGYKNKLEDLRDQTTAYKEAEAAMNRKLQAAVTQFLIAEAKPSIEEQVAAILKQGLSVLRAWESDVREIYDAHGIEFSRKDDFALCRSLFELEELNYKVAAFCQPQLDGGFSHLAWKSQRNRDAKEQVAEVQAEAELLPA